MKFKNYFWLISMAFFVGLNLTLTACGSDDDDEPVPALSVNGTASIESNGTVSGEIVVTSENTDWSVDVTNGKEWLTAYKNGNKVTLAAKENLSIEDRTGTVVITATANAELSQTVTVVQKGSSATITVNGAESTDITFSGVFDNKNGIDFKQTVKVSSNVSWSTTDIPEWLSVSPSNGKGNVEIVIYPSSENATSLSRSATITLNGGGTRAIINVKQNAGKPVCYVDIANEVILHDRMCWEYSATSNVNTFQQILITEMEHNMLTDNEMIDMLSKQEKIKAVKNSVYMFFLDSYMNDIHSNTTYYFITLATDASGKYGELRKTKLTTPIYKDVDDDAWVSFSNYGSDLSTSFWFDTKKEGHCNTYHLIYGCMPSNLIYDSALYAFEINYYLKYRRMHWSAEKFGMKIVTDYPNNHTFTYNTPNLSNSPLCFGYAWGVFKDGTLSSDLTGFLWDTSTENVIQKISSNATPKENILIRRSEEVKRAGKMRK